MDNETRSRISAQIIDLKSRIPEIERDIGDAKRAGLGDMVKADEQTLIKMKALLDKLQAVYG
ncbi:MAG: hypothetical protein WC749_07695 [Dehalococcoidia bacterium]